MTKRSAVEIRLKCCYERSELREIITAIKLNRIVLVSWRWQRRIKTISTRLICSKEHVLKEHYDSINVTVENRRTNMASNKSEDLICPYNTRTVLKKVELL